MKPQSVLVEKKGRIGRITLNRPERLNVLGAEVLGEIGGAFDTLEADVDVDVVILTGSGKAFSAGAEVGELASKDPAGALELSLLGQRLFDEIENLEKPVIAAVNGYALGGGNELALACDLRIASGSALFGQPEVGLGVIPGFGATQRLPRLVGPAKARELIFTGKLIGAREAAKIGLVNQVVPPERLMEEAESLAEAIAGQSAAAVRLAKKALSGLVSEADAFASCFSHPDRRQRMKAFLERQQRGRPRDGRR